jgi:hypothetical protein
MDPTSVTTHKCCAPQPEDRRDIDVDALGNLPVIFKLNGVSATTLFGCTMISLLEPEKADENETLWVDCTAALKSGWVADAFSNNCKVALNGAEIYCRDNFQPIHSKA